MRFSEEVLETVLEPIVERDSTPRTTLLPQPGDLPCRILMLETCYCPLLNKTT